MSEEGYVQIEPRRLVRSKNMRFVACGKDFTCILDAEGQPYSMGLAWGFGRGAKEKILEPTALNLKNVIDISAGSSHCAAIDKEGKLYTWGWGGDWMKGGGHLGHGDISHWDTPTLVMSLSDNAVKCRRVSCGGVHTVILTEDFEVLTCGAAEYGRLGTGATANALIPQTVESLLDIDIVEVAAGHNHTLALSSDGKVWVWGRNDQGQLGLSDSYMDIYSMEDFPRLLEAEALSGSPIKKIAASRGRSAAINCDGELFLWGSKLYHEPTRVDPSSLDYRKVIHVALGGNSRASSISVITEDGALWTFGDGGSRMLGRAARWKKPTPVRVPTFEGKKVLNIFMGPGQHMFALVSVGEE